jgi:hypothetical protein
MGKVFVIFGFAAGGFALNAQDATRLGTVAPSDQALTPETTINRAVVPKLDTRGKAVY